jgi:hypothetical protein
MNPRIHRYCETCGDEIETGEYCDGCEGQQVPEYDDAAEEIYPPSASPLDAEELDY